MNVKGSEWDASNDKTKQKTQWNGRKQTYIKQ